MQYQVPGKCPVCRHELIITNIACSHCKTKFEGQFGVSKFSKLDEDQLEFLGAFVKCRGNLKDMEKEVGLSYPTIRNRLDEIAQALGYGEDRGRTGNEEERKLSKQEILDALEKGEVSAKEAAQLLAKVQR